MVNDDSSPTLTNCTFAGNSAALRRRDVQHQRSSPALTNCTFQGNSADYGGGMYNNDSSPALTNCTFTGNSASTRRRDVQPLLADADQLHPLGQLGRPRRRRDVNDGVLANADQLHLLGQLGRSEAAGCTTLSSSPTLTNCTFSGNSADSGGGMYNYDGSSPTLTNCTFSGNSADSGGGMYNTRLLADADQLHPVGRYP